MCLLILIPHLKKTPHEYICHFFIFMIFSNSYFVMTVFEKDSKYLIWNFSILAFFTFLVLLKMTFLVTLFDRKLQVFKNSPKLTIFCIFGELLATQNVNVARFARNFEWDFSVIFKHCARKRRLKKTARTSRCFTFSLLLPYYRFYHLSYRKRMREQQANGSIIIMNIISTKTDSPCLKIKEKVSFSIAFGIKILRRFARSAFGLPRSALEK